MTDIDYTIFYKTTLSVNEEWTSENEWDIFISAYTPTERVQTIFGKVCSSKKYWLIHPEYLYSEEEYPKKEKNIFSYSPEPLRDEAGFIISDEAEFIRNFFNSKDNKIFNQRICVDITGFMRPHLMFLLSFLKREGVKKLDLIYAEPVYYKKKEKTEFSDGNVLEVRQIKGFEGKHTTDTSNDVLIIGTGYEEALIAQVAENKENARKIQIFGFPSLAPDMYQENILRANKAAESIGSKDDIDEDLDKFFAPANDPFVTASVLKEIVEDLSKKTPIKNLYLCPLGTKVQTLGFGLYYLNECQGSHSSIIFPFCSSYSKETSKGISRIWKYTCEFL